MTSRDNALRIDGPRLWGTIMESGRIGPGVAGGLRRLALTDSDREVRDLFARWCREAGCTVAVDAMGSMFARRPGRDDSLPPVLIGSHLDTQIAGGRFDGILGVLAGLEIVRTLRDRGIDTRRPIEVVNWSNEEGARFQPPMMASAVWAGVQDTAWGHARKDAAGATYGEELRRIGYMGDAPARARPIDSYFELHIEQGPILDAEGIPLGIVAGSFHTRGMKVRVRGQNAHAGPTPMSDRRNSLVGAAMLIVAMNEIGWAWAPDGKSTATQIENWPNLAGIVPSETLVTLDYRHPEQAVVERMTAELDARMAECAEKAQVAYEVAERWSFGGERFDDELVRLLRDTARDLGVPARDILAQAGHDAFHVARVAPACMLFCPCDKGISHNEAESCTLTDIEPSTNVLLHAVLARANA